MILTRLRPSLYLATLMALWGTVVAFMGMVKTPAQLISCRLLIGILEAGFVVSPPHLAMLQRLVRADV